MLQLPTQVDEQRRLAMLQSLGLTDRPRDASLDALAGLAVQLSGAEIGLVTLMDSEVVWVVGAKGFEAPSLRRWDSFCQHLMGASAEPFWVADALQDVRFIANPYVVGVPHVRFYAGVSLSVHGCRVGTLSVLSAEPKAWDAGLFAHLQSLARACEAELSERHRTQAMRQALCASADALIDCDGQGIILSWSEGAERLFGYSVAEAVGAEITLIIPTEHHQGHRDGMARWRENGAARMGRRLELPARRKDGSSLDIELWMSVSHVDGRPRVHANIRDISERAIQARELEAAKEKAERASQAKTHFLTNMGHELRTPLNGVAACAGLLAQAGLSEEHAELVRIIEGGAQQLNQLITDLLDVTRGHDGELEIQPAPHALLDLIENVVGPCRLDAEAKGIDLEVSIAPTADQTVLVDASRLIQTLNLLLSNAVKFTDVGRIRLEVSGSGGRFRFAIEDTGVGFSEDKKSLIFDRFQQVDPTITRRFGGVGLGLSLCRDIVQAMGGTIDCKSVPGEGSRFWIEVPLDSK
ncbi:MAG: sensor histidine kinase [Pseudomonas sp.]|uniref:sensor histidine kinase n=1 Tax=Pseudomonas sp. TaxID=306 RepID=UPI0011F9B6A9|nr:GAF domain-containing sensor histidine kinase [Pseudomonas sp.]RZI70687.1 MAG: sensor histidine kinase [Pseudomonas sp.]